MNHFFAYMARMKYIERWGLMRNTRQENIQEHSLQTAMLAHALAVIRNTFFKGNIDADKVAAVAMFHEASEIITGDLATPIKYYNPEIKKAYKELEHIACGRLIDMLPPELQEVYSGYMLCRDDEINKIVKWADKLCAYFKCVEELNLGNTEFASAEKSILAEIEKIDAPEVKYFMEHFAPSFKLNLDQMG